LRENSLISNRARETHARQIKTNTIGGEPLIRRVQTGNVVAPLRPKTLAPPVIPKINVRNILNESEVGQLTQPQAEVDPVPNCDLKRDDKK
jgi:hypothetical protein